MIGDVSDEDDDLSFENDSTDLSNDNIDVFVDVIVRDDDQDADNI